MADPIFIVLKNFIRAYHERISTIFIPSNYTM